MSKPKTGPKPSAKREAILDAAQIAFLEEGYAATSMDAVATKAGVSKATIYAHFDSKDLLFAAVIHRRCESSEIYATPDKTLDARATLKAVATRLMTLLLSPEALSMYRVVVAESLRQPDLARAFYESGPARGKIEIGAIFSELHRRGELAVSDPWQAADQFVGMLRTDYFMRALLGLAQKDGQTMDGIIDNAVETMVRAYAPA
ncbi:Transcriptional regulator [Candidatus Terasakiella magnetica]|nr:Transcriptional regulator [Candidatus Terasakiella magnetica]